MSRTWFSSDFHGYHAGICRGTSLWDDKQGTRDFDTLEEMNAHLIENINRCCKPEDVLYFGGDFTFGGIDKIWLFRKELQVKTIHYIIGNHCDKIAKNKVLPNCYYAADGQNQGHYDVRAQDLFTSVQDVLTIKLGKKTIFMSHYPHISWIWAKEGSIMVHGHEHGNINHLNEDCRRFDIGIDSAYKILGEYRPFSAEEVIEINEKKPVLKLGHHL
jgi:calcineurin-like phosphoesterase family protein